MNRNPLRSRTPKVRTTTLRWATASALGIGLALAVGPLTAAASSAVAKDALPPPAAGHLSPVAPDLTGTPPHPVPSRPPASATQLAHAATGHAARPHAGTPAVTFIVTTITDSPLTSATSTHCVDAAGGHCSLRAAVEAANNLQKPVDIELGPHTYSLTDTVDGSLVLTNGAGTSIFGKSAATTKIAVPGGDLYRAMFVGEGTASAGSTATLSDLTVSGGTQTASYGGGIWVDGGNVSLVLSHVAVTHDTAEFGGGVACDSGSVWATDSSISGDTAADGGGLYADFCQVHLQSAQLNADTAANSSNIAYGGGVYAYYGEVHLVGCSVSHDTAGTATGAGYGGGIYDEYASLFTVGTMVDHDAALFDGAGGGVVTSSATFVATGGSLDFDKAQGTSAIGGGLYLESESLIELHHVDVSHDATGSTSVYDGGGGIFALSDETSATLVVDAGSTIEGNATGGVVAESDYGGVRVDISHSTIKNNGDANYGAGGVFGLGYEYGGTSIALTDDVITGNHDGTADSAGGALAFAYEYAASDLTVTSCLVQGNVASGSSGAGGIGGQQIEYSSVNVVVDASKVLGNHAPVDGYGGGIGVWQETGNGHASLQVNQDTITGNVAGKPGGEGLGAGVMVYDQTLLDITGSTISGNVAEGTGYGAGVYNSAYLGMTVTGSTIDSNRAQGASYGGGIYTDTEYGSTDVVDSTLLGNSAAYGGGIYSFEYQLDVQGSTIAKNVAHDGGGIYNEYDSVFLTNSTLSGNHAAAEGGAVFVYDYWITLYLTTVSDNAAGAGGGIYTAKNGTGTIRDSILSGNHGDCHAVGRYAYLTSAGDNVLGHPSCVDRLNQGDVVSAAPKLGALTHNGGPTETMALLAGSPALSAVHATCTPTDQRGVPRPAGVCDSGAYQHHGAPAH